MILRGVNLGGSSKVPASPNGATHISEGFFNHREVSFVGRPFPLAEADEHFSRLRAWGLTFLRFLVSWEAIEHAGPGIYDDDYLDYIRAVIEKAHEYGIQMFIDPHQDVWSRFCGGDGAPGWTMEAVGMDLTKVQPTGAAIIHSQHGDPFPRMIWPTNAHKLAAATMFALFFGGNELAPETKIEGESAQEFLQHHYIASIRRLASWIRDLPNVAGFDTLNEPMYGYMGVHDLDDCCGRPRLGDFPTPLQAMLAASGQSVEIDVWDYGLRGNYKKSRRILNPTKERLWRDGYDCVWRQNGVWDLGTHGEARLLKPEHFYAVDGHVISVANDYYKPFANRFAREIRAEMPDALIFLETEPSTPPPQWGADDAARIVYAPHWYDGVTLMFKNYFGFLGADYFTARPIFGSGGVERSFQAQLARFTEESQTYLGGAPVLIGEIGIPYDMNNKKSFQLGDFSTQAKAMDRSLHAVEANLLSATIWNYTADNNNARGDHWNDEDLSIFSRDQQHDTASIHSGGRALGAAVRPYPAATAGQPLRFSFNHRSRICEYEFEHDPLITEPTELFIPKFQYPAGFQVEARQGSWSYDAVTQLLTYIPAQQGGKHLLRIRPI